MIASIMQYMTQPDGEEAVHVREQIGSLVTLLRLVQNALGGISHGLEATAGVHSLADDVLLRLQQGDPVSPDQVGEVRQALKELEIAAGVDGIAQLRAQLALISTELGKAFEIEE